MAELANDLLASPLTPAESNSVQDLCDKAIASVPELAELTKFRSSNSVKISFAANTKIASSDLSGISFNDKATTELLNTATSVAQTKTSAIPLVAEIMGPLYTHELRHVVDATNVQKILRLKQPFQEIMDFREFELTAHGDAAIHLLKHDINKNAQNANNILKNELFANEGQYLLVEAQYGPKRLAAYAKSISNKPSLSDNSEEAIQYFNKTFQDKNIDTQAAQVINDQFKMTALRKYASTGIQRFSNFWEKNYYPILKTQMTEQFKQIDSALQIEDKNSAVKIFVEIGDRFVWLPDNHSKEWKTKFAQVSKQLAPTIFASLNEAKNDDGRELKINQYLSTLTAMSALPEFSAKIKTLESELATNIKIRLNADLACDTDLYSAQKVEQDLHQFLAVLEYLKLNSKAELERITTQTYATNKIATDRLLAVLSEKFSLTATMI